MRALLPSSLLMGIALCGCAALPEPPPEDGIAVQEIVTAVQCELANVYSRTNKASIFDQYVAGVELNLKVTNHIVNTAGVSWNVPVLPDTLSLGAGPTFDDTSLRNANFQFNVAMSSLKTKVVSGHFLETSCQAGNTGLPQASKTLGLGDWLYDSAEAVLGNGIAELSSAGYIIDFTVVRGLDGNLAFKATHVGVTASSSLRNNVENILNVTMTHIPAAPAAGARPIRSSSGPGGATAGVAAPGGSTYNLQSPGGLAGPSVQDRIDYNLQKQRLNSIFSPSGTAVPLAF